MKSAIGSRPWAGLDIGAFSVKLLVLQGVGGGARSWTAEVPLPPERRLDDGTQPADVIAEAIDEAFGAAGISLRGVRGLSLGIAGPDVIVKHITLPLLDENEVGPALRFEARKHLPFDPQTMILDYQVLGRIVSERKLEVLLAAVAHDHVERHLAGLKLLGVEPDILDPAPLALANALLHGRETEPGVHVILDIGESASHLALFQRGQPFFTRRLEFGGRTLTKAIAEGTQVPFEEADEWKLAAGADQPGLRVDWGSREMQSVLQVMRRDLVEELRRSFAFYGTQGSLPDSMRLWISGGSSRLPGFAAKLAEVLGMPVQLFDPLAMLSGGRNDHSGPQFAQAFGLALRSP
jgi:type IV pilus assembly protein PilM